MIPVVRRFFSLWEQSIRLRIEQDAPLWSTIGTTERSIVPEAYFETFIRALANCPDRDGVIGEEQLEFPPRENFGYEATPKNAVTFGSMGVDGVHYAVLKLDGKIGDDSPVIQISPMDFSSPYSLLADSLLDYFAVGCGVSLREMQRTFDDERQGRHLLVEFLRERFDHAKLWRAGRNRSIEPYRHLLEIDEDRFE